MAEGLDRLTIMQRRTFLSAITVGAARLSLPAGVVALSGCTGSAHDEALVGFDGKTMGTRFSVRYSREVEAPEGLRSRVQSVLDQVDMHMSTYNPNSELSRFNQGTGDEWIEVSKDTYTVVSQARCANFADSAFDPTIGPLVDLWGFGPQHRPLRDQKHPTSRNVSTGSVGRKSKPTPTKRHSASHIRKPHSTSQASPKGSRWMK